MPASDRTVERPASPPRILDFARAFRAAARAVGFYPPAHQKVVEALDHLLAAARAAAGDGSVCLTVLPHGLMAGGMTLDATEAAFADLAAICHRHGVGALILDGRATADAWRALFTLLARKPEDIRASGGIQRQWKALHHRSPAILEIDFGALLRGQVGGDFSELAGVISHYLETAGVGGSILDDPCGALRRAIEAAPDDEQAVTAMLRELRAAAQLTWAKPEQFDDVFRRAAAVGEFVPESLMAVLLGRRGTPEATVGPIDVVEALVERMPNPTISKFLSRALSEGGSGGARITDVFTSLVPDVQRRRLIVSEAQDVALGAGALAQWAALERALDAQSDKRFLPEDYVDEIHSARDRASRGGESGASLAQIEAWTRSIGDDAVRETDLLMLEDLARIESDDTRARRVLEILQAHVLEAAEKGDWDGAGRTAGVIRTLATGAADDVRRAAAGEALDKLAQSPAASRALDLLPDADDEQAGHVERTLAAIGPALAPALAAHWAAARQVGVRSRLERVVAGCGRPGRDALRRLLSSDSAPTEVRVAAIRLLELTPGTEHLPLLEAALSDRQEDVRRVAFDALAASQSDRARDILARGLARAEPRAQAVLLERLSALGPERLSPILHRAFELVDPGIADLGVYLSMIAAIGRAGGEGAGALLAGAARRVTWRTPLRAWRVRSAVRGALRASAPAAALGRRSR